MATKTKKTSVKKASSRLTEELLETARDMHASGLLTSTAQVNIEKSSGNIFADLGLPDSDELMLKAHLVMSIAQAIERKGLTQTQAAERIGLKRPDVSKLLRGRFKGFSLERLFSFVRMLGTDVEIKFKPSKPKREGRILMVA